jgi:hypothetical protein
MAVSVSVGHTVNLFIQWFDQNGAPMAVTPTPSSPPSWSHTDPAIGTLIPAADGLTATDAITASGTDVVGLTAIVNDISYTAMALEIDASSPGSQVLTTIAIGYTVT